MVFHKHTCFLFLFFYLAKNSRLSPAIGHEQSSKICLPRYRECTQCRFSPITMDVQLLAVHIKIWLSQSLNKVAILQEFQTGSLQEHGHCMRDLENKSEYLSSKLAYHFFFYYSKQSNKGMLSKQETYFPLL